MDEQDRREADAEMISELTKQVTYWEARYKAVLAEKDPPGAVGAEEFEMARITIVKTFDDKAQGGAAITTFYSDNLALADALGMLSFAEHMTVRQYLGDDD